MTKVLAIDGPSGAGKGTVARSVARALNWAYVDTGAMYRAVAWKIRREALPIDDEDRIAAIADAAVFELDFSRIVIDGEDVTRFIRTPEIDAAAATVARLPSVRRVLVARQRGYAVAGPVVMEGRDIGTIVFPDAAVKLYLDATPEERAQPSCEGPRSGVVQSRRDQSRGLCPGDPGPARPDAAGVSADPSGRRHPDRDDRRAG